MFLGHHIKKRSMDAYDKVIVPELKGYRSNPEEQPLIPLKPKRPVKGALRGAACIILALVLIGVVVSKSNTGANNSFVLTAYAASASENPISENNYTLGMKSFDLSSGVSMQKHTKTVLPVMKLYIAHDAEGNNYGGSSDDFSIFDGADIIESSKHVDYTSGLQFSGDTIDSITMTSQNGKFIAYDFSKFYSINQKYAKIVDKGNGVSVCTIDDRDFSDSDKAFMDSHIRTGQTVTFPPDGYTAYWHYTIIENEKTSDTIEITVHYSDGTAQNSVLSISEDDTGNIIAELN